MTKTADKLAIVSKIARQTLIDEVSATPKPGLVDCSNCGAHDDMNIDTFIKSANVLEHFFYEFAEYGYSTAYLKATDILNGARKIGLDAEKAMYQATGGVNTHKGMIFSGGLVCLSVGRLIALNDTICIDNICGISADVVNGICECDYSVLDNKIQMSNGEKIYKEHGVKGSRGEAESGFITVRKYSYPFLKECIEKRMPKNEVLVRTLMKTMSVIEDTNVIKRGGIEYLKYIKNRSAELINAEFCEIEQFDKELIHNNISPGGSADILAVTWLIYNIEQRMG